MSAIDTRNLTLARSLQQAAFGRGKFPGPSRRDESAAIELLTRNYLSGPRAGNQAKLASDGLANRFVSGRDLSRVVSALSQNLGGIQRGLDAVSAANSALEKIKGLLQQAQGLVSSGDVAAPVAPEPAPEPEPEIRRDYIAAEATGSSSLQADKTAQVVGTKSISGLGGTLSSILGQGKTLTVTVGSQTTTIRFGLLGGVTTSEQLRTQLDNISGIKASLVDGGYLKIEAAPQENPAAERGFTLGGTADLQTALGIAEQSYSGTSLLTQGLTEGQTLTFQAGDGEAQTITFGYGAGQVSSLQELDDALSALDGVTASIDGQNRLTFKVDDAQASLTLGGTADVETVFGLAERVYAPTVIETVIPPEPPAQPEPPAETTSRPEALDPSIRKSLNDIRRDIEAAIEGANVGGVNLLRKGALDVRFEGDAQATRAREGANLSAPALGLDVLAENSDASRSEIDGNLAQALGRVELEITQFDNDRSVLEARLEFNETKLGVLEEISVEETTDDTGKPEDKSQVDIDGIAAETRRLFAETLFPGEDGIVENDRAVLEELFAAPLERQNP